MLVILVVLLVRWCSFFMVFFIEFEGVVGGGEGVVDDFVLVVS